MQNNDTHILDAILERIRKNARVGILMSGAGSNALKLLEHRHEYPNLDFRTIYSDNPQSNAATLAADFGIKSVVLPFSTFADRNAFFVNLATRIREDAIDVLIYAGFMKVSPSWFVEEFPGINMHPSDLSVRREGGEPKYTGMNAVPDTIRNGERRTASTLHVVASKADFGTPIIISPYIELSGTGIEDSQEVHERIKVECEHPTYYRALKYLSQESIDKDLLPIRFIRE